MVFKHFGNNLEVFVNDNIFFEKILSEDFRKKLFLENRIYKLGWIGKSFIVAVEKYKSANSILRNLSWSQDIGKSQTLPAPRHHGPRDCAVMLSVRGLQISIFLILSPDVSSQGSMIGQM